METFSQTIDSSSSDTSISSVSLPPYDDHLGICHFNVQSILPKIDVLQYEMQTFDIYVFTETWLNADICDNDINVVNYRNPFRCDKDVRSGGVAIYVKQTLNVVRRRDLELYGLECVWIQVKIRGHDILVCGIYRPLDANLDYWSLIHESIDRAKSTNVQDIVILGDLNNDLLVNNRSKKLQNLYIASNHMVIFTSVVLWRRSAKPSIVRALIQVYQLHRRTYALY